MIGAGIVKVNAVSKGHQSACEGNQVLKSKSNTWLEEREFLFHPQRMHPSHNAIPATRDKKPDQYRKYTAFERPSEK